MLDFIRMYRQNSCHELWDLPTVNSQTVVIWDVTFLGVEEQLDSPAAGRGLPASLSALPWSGWPGFAALAGQVKPAWVQEPFSNRAASIKWPL